MISDLCDCYLLCRIIKRKLLLPKRTKYSSSKWENDLPEPATKAKPLRLNTSSERSTTGGSISWISWPPGKKDPVEQDTCVQNFKAFGPPFIAAKDNPMNLSLCSLSHHFSLCFSHKCHFH